MHANVTRLAIGCVALVLVCGCDRTTSGTASDAAPSSAPTATTETSPTASTETSGDMHSLPPYGVVETTKHPVTAGETTCAPDSAPTGTVEVRGAAPGAPIVTIAVPEGFAPGAPGQGDVALNLTGPDGMTGTVTIAPTTLDAAAAFQKYADERTADYEISSVSVLPGELCDYSGQELMGTLADHPGQGIDYADRVIHVWTNDGDFLIALRLEAPNGTAGLDTAKSVMLADFGVRMP
jgi:hypothetical protein